MIQKSMASVTKQYNLVPAKGQWCSAAEGVALAMLHRLSGLSTYGLKGLSLCGRSAPAYASGHGPLYLYRHDAFCNRFTAVSTNSIKSVCIGCKMFGHSKKEK